MQETETIEKILEILEAGGCEISESNEISGSYETFSCYFHYPSSM
jgi:hypothetical protein